MRGITEVYALVLTYPYLWEREEKLLFADLLTDIKEEVIPIGGLMEQALKEKLECL
jgi:hypothetical protein